MPRKTMRRGGPGDGLTRLTMLLVARAHADTLGRTAFCAWGQCSPVRAQATAPRGALGQEPPASPKARPLAAEASRSCRRCSAARASWQARGRAPKRGELNAYATCYRSFRVSRLTISGFAGVVDLP